MTDEIPSTVKSEAAAGRSVQQSVKAVPSVDGIKKFSFGRMVWGALGLLCLIAPWVFGGRHGTDFGAIVIPWYFAVVFLSLAFESSKRETKTTSKRVWTKPSRRRRSASAKPYEPYESERHRTIDSSQSTMYGENSSVRKPTALPIAKPTSPLLKSLPSVPNPSDEVIYSADFNPNDLSEALDLIAQRQQDRALVPAVIEARLHIEKVAMEIAMEYEQECGFSVEDVSAKNLGYDLHSTLGEEERRIEVKGLSGSGAITLTDHEVSVATTFPASYLIYVVENCAAVSGKRLHIIKNFDYDKLQPQTVDYSLSLEEQNRHATLIPLT